MSQVCTNLDCFPIFQYSSISKNFREEMVVEVIVGQTSVGTVASQPLMSTCKMSAAYCCYGGHIEGQSIGSNDLSQSS